MIMPFFRVRLLNYAGQKIASRARTMFAGRDTNEDQIIFQLESFLSITVYCPKHLDSQESL